MARQDMPVFTAKELVTIQAALQWLFDIESHYPWEDPLTVMATAALLDKVTRLVEETKGFERERSDHRS